MRTIESRPTSKGEPRFRVRFRHNGALVRETFTSKGAAERFARELDALGATEAVRRLDTQTQTPDAPTVDEIAAGNIEHLTGIEDGTRLSYTRLWSRTWAGQFGHVPVNLLGRDDIARAINALGKEYARKSLENQRGLLVGVLDRAVDQGYLPKNPAKGMRLPRGVEGERVEMRIITPAEFPVVLDGISPAAWAQLVDAGQRPTDAVRPPGIKPHYRTFVRLLYGVGCRYGEAVALQVQDWQRPNLRIRRAMKWSPDNNRTIGATKTKKSNRTVAVPSELHDELDALVAGKARADLIFTAARGGEIHHRSFWGGCGGQPSRTSSRGRACTTCATPTPASCSAPACPSTSSRRASAMSRSRRPSTPTATSSPTPRSPRPRPPTAPSPATRPPLRSSPPRPEPRSPPSAPTSLASSHTRCCASWALNERTGLCRASWSELGPARTSSYNTGTLIPESLGCFTVGNIDSTGDFRVHN